MNEQPAAAVETFRQAYCRLRRCSPEAFARSVLRRSFPPLARPLGSLLLALKPEMFRRELVLIGRLGDGTGEAGLRGELEGYVYENDRDKPFRVVTLGLRLSRRRFLHVYRETMQTRAG